MDTIQHIRQLATSFPEVSELPHFEKTSFRVKGKIFATLGADADVLVVKLSEMEQNLFSQFVSEAIYPVPNKWGKQGWTQAEIRNLSTEMLTDLLTSAYCHVAPASLAKQVRPL